MLEKLISFIILTIFLILLISWKLLVIAWTVVMLGLGRALLFIFKCLPFNLYEHWKMCYEEVQYFITNLFCLACSYFLSEDNMHKYNLFQIFDNISFFITLIISYNIALFLFSLSTSIYFFFEPVVLNMLDLAFTDPYQVFTNGLRPSRWYSPFETYQIIVWNLYAIYKHFLVLTYEQLFYILWPNRWYFIQFINIYYPAQFDFHK